ncbi:hypothetical protein PsorP6_011906 [Peronosclerospora sorghi]|uniref:Uncharacterized protein n=1 Tax=Peronosclerospora sorghi TaxID=230839 RepID=A0ACC0WJN5_9STRA|nr:hypothetical protein PsorP6_011906 [Peronosclerospora sorghi]
MCDATIEAENKTQLKVLRRLEEAGAILKLAAGASTKIIDPRTTLEQLEQEVRRRKREEKNQEEKEKEACTRKKIRLAQYKKYAKQAVQQVQRENSLAEAKEAIVKRQKSVPLSL